MTPKLQCSAVLVDRPHRRIVEPGFAFGADLKCDCYTSSGQTCEALDDFLNDGCHLFIATLRVDFDCAMIAGNAFRLGGEGRLKWARTADRAVVCR